MGAFPFPSAAPPSRPLGQEAIPIGRGAAVKGPLILSLSKDHPEPVEGRPLHGLSTGHWYQAEPGALDSALVQPGLHRSAIRLQSLELLPAEGERWLLRRSRLRHAQRLDQVVGVDPPPLDRAVGTHVVPVDDTCNPRPAAARARSRLGSRAHGSVSHPPTRMQVAGQPEQKRREPRSSRLLQERIRTGRSTAALDVVPVLVAKLELEEFLLRHQAMLAGRRRVTRVSPLPVGHVPPVGVLAEELAHPVAESGKSPSQRRKGEEEGRLPFFLRARGCL